MIKYTHAENRKMVEILNVQAHGIGLLEPDENLEYRKGNTSYGHSTEIGVIKTREDGQRENVRRPDWVPEFGYKDGPSVVGAALVAAGNVIFHLYQKQINKEHAERKARLGLSE